MRDPKGLFSRGNREGSRAERAEEREQRAARGHRPVRDAGNNPGIPSGQPTHQDCTTPRRRAAVTTAYGATPDAQRPAPPGSWGRRCPRLRRDRRVGYRMSYDHVDPPPGAPDPAARATFAVMVGVVKTVPGPMSWPSNGSPAAIFLVGPWASDALLRLRRGDDMGPGHGFKLFSLTQYSLYIG